MPATPRSSIIRDLRSANIWDHRNISTCSHRSISDWDRWIRTSGITGVSSGITAASYGVAGSTSSGILRASPSGAAGPSFPEPNTETNRQMKRVHTLTIVEGHLRADPETGYAESTQEDQEPLATFYGLRVHPQANLWLSLLPERRTHQHRDQEIDTDRMIKSGG